MARRDTSFYYSFVVLPRDQRRAIMAVWDFCRAVDDAVDEQAGNADRVVARTTAVAELAKWRRELAASFDGGPLETTVARNLVPHISAFNLPRRAFEDVIDGVEMDLDERRYATFDDLHQYCLRVASAVGLICIEIFGYKDARCREYALNLGVALQLTNILRDLGKDLGIGRLYLPQDDLARCGVTEDALRAGVVSGPVRSLLTLEAEKARDYYRRAALALPPIDARRLVAARIMGAIYFDLLRRIERSGYAVFGPAIRAPRWRKAFLAAKVWTQSMLGLPVERSMAGAEPR
ncbi:MAG: presqualene diphosphate synthase HpnD [Acidobacteria bacterium]|nr:presqualene diphosphate synthase HpnD [Acidobacteriota bacterium]